MEEPRDHQSDSLEIKPVKALSGLNWLGEAFSLMFKAPGSWLGMFVLFLLIAFFMSSFEFLQILASVLSPIFMGGFMFAADKARQGKSVMIDDLFAGFKQAFRPLFRLGLLYLAMNILIVVILGFFVEQQLTAEQVKAVQQASTTAEMEQVLREYPRLADVFISALLWLFVLLIPVMMASWMAPALILLAGAGPIEALKLSFMASAKNWLAFTVLGVALIPLYIMALMPLFLGMLVMMPITFICQYLAFADIFQITQDEPENQDTFLV